MAYNFLVFDFGSNEEAAQHARHKLEGWKQAFRLGKKLELKFNRKESEPRPASLEPAQPKPQKSAKTKREGKPGPKSASEPVQESAAAAPPSADIQILVRLDFSDHEKLSRQRWLNRIPAEEPFKSANTKALHSGDSEYAATSDLFDSLE